MKLVFEWDKTKEKTNQRKHKVGFEEGKTIFNDPSLFTFLDTERSESEKRYINLGLFTSGRILVLTHTERHGRIRIISCRKATARERKFYEEGERHI